ncbi:NAD(P)-dependent oxidoreductase [Haliovirga abyssi]|uniref:D-3-phosphoglycerate dehydrogenase n=1 Tax=Haliovirga abyssi TaxID=2996794 RepID=A0AAU9DER6_9FUSO|nr:NAD(P)-dependent oxidoreductase [Haliovirga abyssi]BDU49837.1 D-3-phosphoglycerate dehydrogenase [Haliovirga abyssi]
MKIVFLDAVSVGEDISLGKIEKEGELIKYNLTKENEIEDRIKDAEVIITNKVYIGKKEMGIARKLKLICVAATGYNNIDIEEAKKLGIVVANVKNYSTNSVVQMVFSYILMLMSNLYNYNNDVKNGEWSKSPIFTMLKYSIQELNNKKIGIIGYGTIGKKVGEIAKSFGMDIIVAKIHGREYSDNSRVEIEELLKISDIVTIHAPLTNLTKKLISNKEFNLMKKNAILINTARGGIVDEKALYKALKDKKIAGAAIDVLENEPPKENNELYELENILITPHVAWGSIESRQRLIEGIYENIREYKNGNRNKINIWRSNDKS